MRLSFAGRSAPDVGISLELQLVDAETLLPLPAAQELLSQLQDEPRFSPSLYQSAIQLSTQIQPSISACEGSLRQLLERLHQLSGQQGLALLASGSHPIQGWREMHLSQDVRHEAFIRRLQWVGRRAAVFGLRIHVGVPDGEKAIALCNSLASVLPILLALSGSSPYWRGVDTGLASCRVRVIENIPNAGLPPNLLNFGEFQAYVRTLRAAESIERVTDILWDIRPNLQLGTLELQVCDAPHTVQETLALAALTQALVVWMLERYEEGEPIPFSEPWIARENKWRAARFGIDAELVHTAEGELRPLRTLFHQLRERLAEVTERHGLEPQLARLDALFSEGPGYMRQRRVGKVQGLQAVCELLRDELLADRALG